MEALGEFHSSRTRKLDLVNGAYVVLLPKTNGAASVTDFRPISLINSLAKIITKILADRLAPRLNELVSGCQNAFIQKRCIHDNFLYVQNVIKALHKAKRPSLFIKLDISKSFDSMSWVFFSGNNACTRFWAAMERLDCHAPSYILFQDSPKWYPGPTNYACKGVTTGRPSVANAIHLSH
jgi:hypothetical protein